MIVQPIVKWAGGKRSIMYQVRSYFPKNIHTYIEPFCGGAAIALNLDCQKIIINDINQDLVKVYSHFQGSEYCEVLQYLKDWQESQHYLSETFYKSLREDFNGNYSCEVKRSAQFLALNKLGFNGLFRVNSKGLFNVPWGRKKRGTKIYDEEKFEVFRQKIKNIEVRVGSYSDLEYPSGSFVYFDPPYDTDGKDFTSYHSTRFEKPAQKNLREFCDKLTRNNIKFCQSNADTPDIRDWYQDYNIYEVEAPRRISAKVKGRKPVQELLITNY